MARPLFSIISFILLLGAMLFEFFIILSGGEGVTKTPENLIYFLQADTSGMNAPNPARWTYWAVCGTSDGKHNANCGAVVPALPFDPPSRHNFNSDSGVPDQFLNTHYYYYLSRFAWVSYLLALLFAVFAFFTSGLALCTRIGAWIAAFNTFIALFWQSLAAALMTAWTVKARNVFRQNGRDASLGKYAYGFSWGAVALLFLATLTFCLAGGHKRDNYSSTTTTTRRRGVFGRRRNSMRKEYV